MPKTQDYKALISEYIKKQMIILGPVVAVEKARKLDRMKLKDDGVVTQVNGDGEEIMNMVESEFEGMIGSVAHTVLLRVIDSLERSSQPFDSRKLEIDSRSDSRDLEIDSRSDSRKLEIDSRSDSRKLEIDSRSDSRKLEIDSRSDSRDLEIDKSSVAKGATENV